MQRDRERCVPRQAHMNRLAIVGFLLFEFVIYLFVHEAVMFACYYFSITEQENRKGEKIADLIKEQKELNDQLARGEGLSGKEQQRMAQLDELLKNARVQEASAFAEGSKLANSTDLER